jgi:hypothetical protein
MEGKAAHPLGFSRDSISVFCSVEIKCPSFKDAVLSVESWAGVISKRNKQLQYISYRACLPNFLFT